MPRVRRVIVIPLGEIGDIAHGEDEGQRQKPGRDDPSIEFLRQQASDRAGQRNQRKGADARKSRLDPFTLQADQ